MSNVAPPSPIDLDQAAVLLDVDGTLLDLALTPQAVAVPPGLRATLQELWRATSGALAFVSGRRLDDLDRIFAPLRLPAVGGHGSEMRVSVEDNVVAARVRPLDLALRRRLVAIAKDIPGVLAEDKGYALALHYRMAPEQGERVQARARACLEGVADCELLPGKLLVEVKRKGANKAVGIRALMAHAPFAGRRPLFIGDDITDQDAFAAMAELGGIAISVGGAAPGVRYCLAAPADVRRWLAALLHRESCAAT
jgi:trehalose 6-phosphate phosphatase